MRKLSVVALASVLTLGAAAVVSAQTATTPSTSMDKPATTTSAKTTTTTTTTKTAHAVHATGKVTAMDATAKTLTIKSTYNLQDDTKYTVKGKAATMSDVHVGDTVTVTYWKDGMKATKVNVTKAAPATKM
jgi:sRNA-binding protein